MSDNEIIDAESNRGQSSTDISKNKKEQSPIKRKSKAKAKKYKKTQTLYQFK